MRIKLVGSAIFSLCFPGIWSLTIAGASDHEMIKAVIFDVDGTLVDTVDLHAQAWQEALQRFGHAVSFIKVREQIGKGGDQLLPVFLRPGACQTRKQIEEFRSKLYNQKYLPRARAFPKVRELFQKMSASGKSIALGSSCKQDELDIYKRLAQIEDLSTVDASGDDVDSSGAEPRNF